MTSCIYFSLFYLNSLSSLFFCLSLRLFFFPLSICLCPSLSLSLSIYCFLSVCLSFSLSLSVRPPFFLLYFSLSLSISLSCLANHTDVSFTYSISGKYLWCAEALRIGEAFSPSYEHRGNSGYVLYLFPEIVVRTFIWIKKYKVTSCLLIYTTLNLFFMPTKNKYMFIYTYESYGS